MIAEFVKTSNVKPLIEYNEYKVEKGEATKIVDTTFGNHPGEIIQTLEMNADLNDRLRSNKFQHIIFNFHESDFVPPEIFLSVWNDYCIEMGYKDFNHAIYQHHDTHLNHYHVVMPTVDVLGQKFDDYNDFINNRDITRMLEKKHGMYEIIYERFEKSRQQYELSEKYSIYNLVKKNAVLKHNNIVLGKSFISTIRKYKMDNDEIRSHYAESNIGFEQLKSIADKQNKTIKGKLIDRLRQLKRLSSNYDDFEKRVKANGIYIKRYKEHKSNSFRMVYGIKEEGVYVKNTKLPKDLRFAYLFASNEKEYTRDDQVKFLKNIAIRSSRKSTSWNEYVALLKTYKISVQTKSNKNGIYAYSLRSDNIHNGVYIPASEIYRQLSIAKLPFMSTTKKRKSAKSKQATVTKSNAIARVSNILDMEHDIEQDQERKNQMDREEEL